MNKKGFTPLIVTIIIALIVGAGFVGYQIAQIKGEKVITSVPTTIIATTSTKNAVSNTIIPRSILVYLTPKEYNGNLGGRKGADSKCTPPVGTPCLPRTQHALLSASAQDQARDMSKNFGFDSHLPVFWYNYKSHKFIPLVNQWNYLFVNKFENPNILNTQKDALQNESFVWTGSDNNGLVRSQCKGWTTSYVEDPGAGTGPFGTFGSYDNMFWESDGWAGISFARQCNKHYPLRCMCLSKYHK